MKIEKGKRVRMNVMLKVKGGDVIEKSTVEYFQGAGTMLPGLEAELEGLEAGARKKGTLPAARAFGDESKLPTKTLKRTEFPKDAQLREGEKFAAKGPGGQDVFFRIMKVKGDEVDVKFLHPLGDKDIEFEVEILKVTDPAPPPMPGDLLEEAD